MTLATEKEKLSTSRAQLVRLEVCRNVTDELTLDSTNFYTVTLPFDVGFASLEGISSGQTVTFTEVADTPNANLEYRFTESTRTLEVYLTSPPSADFQIGLIYYLFFTNAVTRYTYEDPLDNATTVREWQPRLTSRFTVKQSFTNVIYGQVTYQASSLTLGSKDGDLHQHFSATSSVSTREVLVWQFLGNLDVANGLKLFKGRASSPSFTSSSVTIPVYDDLQLLDERCTYAAGNVTDLYADNTIPQDYEKPYPVISAPVSYFSSFTQNTVTTTPQIYPAFVDEAIPATVVSYNQSISTSTNRTWRACRTPLADLPNQSYGTITRTVSTGAGYRFWKFSTYSNLHVGHTFSWTEGGTRYYALITHVGEFTYSGNTYDIAINDSAAPGSTSSTIHVNPCIGVLITGMANYDNPGLYPMHFRDFTMSATASSGTFNFYGCTRQSIVFASNFEANFPSAPTLDPGSHSVQFTVAQTGDFKHGKLIERLLYSAGLTPDSASITAANTALTDSVYHQIPYRSENTYGSHRKYIEDILRSTLGYLRVGSDGEIEYKLLEAPTTGLALDESNCELEAIDVSYDDVVGSVVFRNEHLNATTTSPSLYRDETDISFARQTHGFVREADLSHVLGPSNTITKATDIASIRARAFTTYRMKVATLAIDLLLGDDVTVTADWILGGEGTKNLKVIGLEKGIDGVTITATDLEGL